MIFQMVFSTLVKYTGFCDCNMTEQKQTLFVLHNKTCWSPAKWVPTRTQTNPGGSIFKMDAALVTTGSRKGAPTRKTQLY